ncbi:hypothetical protein EJ04DRAFT_559907 [Polyplosphaeria fusca]|uniref:Uncharacterized protein n=1 Tax=Polyplosphaeria fusca TaxID=682080 RepID=A0A9P4R635_9PLEO|nr:hypothetical protein EJ04DRAFT_559907 [Polyplosphaeria fusca]
MTRWEQILQLNLSYLRQEIDVSPKFQGPLYSETIPLVPAFARLHEYGILTCSSQPGRLDPDDGVVMKCSHEMCDNERFLQIKQKAFLWLLVPTEHEGIDKKKVARLVGELLGRNDLVITAYSENDEYPSPAGPMDYPREVAPIEDEDLNDNVERDDEGGDEVEGNVHEDGEVEEEKEAGSEGMGTRTLDPKSRDGICDGLEATSNEELEFSDEDQAASDLIKLYYFRSTAPPIPEPHFLTTRRSASSRAELKTASEKVQTNFITSLPQITKELSQCGTNYLESRFRAVRRVRPVAVGIAAKDWGPQVDIPAIVEELCEQVGLQRVFERINEAHLEEQSRSLVERLSRLWR